MKQKLFSMFALLLMAATGAWAQTTVNGIFTVNADGDLVQFASGNLRYTSGAWSFFDHQYDYYAEYSADSWDKFGWSTSGTTYGKSTSTNENLYKGDFVDWGNAVGTGWRTLSNDEWGYVVNTRSGSTIGTTANARFAKAKVNDVQGLILFPDTYTHPDGVTAPVGVNATGSTGWNGNNYTAADWTKMESAGCVFLPAAGGRYNQSNPTLVVNAGTEGNYWSSTSDNSTANLLTFSGYSFNPSITDSPRMGYSVRLVKSAPTYSITLAEGTEDEGNWNVPAKAAEGAKVTATYSGDRKVKSVKAVKKAASLIVNPVVGQIIGSDGKNYDANATLPTGVTAVAKIAYVGNDAETSTTYNHGLALALEDVPGTTINWCSQTDATCLGTGHQFDSEAGAKGDMAGIANTDALVNNTGHTHAAASAARNYNSGTHPAGTSAWFLPSAGQWNKMFNAAGGYENLKNNASLQNDDENYWSSTEYNAGGAWDFYSDGGSWYHNSKSNSYDRVRPCLAF